jgi:hypothetical protein
MSIPGFNCCFDLFPPATGTVEKATLVADIAESSPKVTDGTKMSYLFKRLTLVAAAHFVNSLPLAMPGLSKHRGGRQ